MAILDPTKTTVQDICLASLKEAGVVGRGQTASTEDLSDAQARLQWMLQEWAVERYLVYHQVTYLIPSTGAQSYSIGPNGLVNTDVKALPWNAQFNAQFGLGPAAGPPAPSRASARPDRILSAFLRQVTVAANQVDYPLEQLFSLEDYNRIALKNLTSFPGWFYYDPDWPLGHFYPWPLPQANTYALGISFKEQLPVSWAKSDELIVLPYPYNGAILYNLAMRLRARFQIGTYPGDPLPGFAKSTKQTLRASQAQIAALRIPGELVRPGIYNIFSDSSY